MVEVIEMIEMIERDAKERGHVEIRGEDTFQEL